ncbi:oxidoreductase domain protein [Thermobaculum terrenum ATCC BAA-798]|uniref:Oxidoreductase domain protein n=1 Tax=Thermobaculum terrenum (strain ATCC BAA-798 / CCMEE 7001 / YNP1) TaxID=525904 RepID=D1CI50_THET1|nr:Gfo/Idh/MocA family oxidoreductase [Thermobaculum terrenum]ACZ43421.1 oxidoreductase domain protein [Thermobaculum terrenum ATCC BAA-798]
MPRRRVRFGIIGAGLMGREFAVASARWPALLDLDVAPEIVAVCDVDPAAFAWYRERFPSVALYTHDYRELLASDEVEAVYCAIPHNLHAQVYVDAIEAGKHLLGEKPFGIDLPAYERIMRAVRAHPEVLVRVSSEFPFYPGAQRIVQAVQQGRLGRIIEVRAGFLHSSDLDPNKPINWKRRADTNGEYGCMGDLGMHVVHLPARFGWLPKNVRALLSNIVPERPDQQGRMVPCDTWDNAILATEVEAEDQSFPMILETKRISPGETNTWYLEVMGTERSLAFSTKRPRTLRFLEYRPGGEQAWQSLDLGHESVYRTVTGGIFEFGFPDAILQMWAAFLDELAHGEEMIGGFRCATPQEAGVSHSLFTAALESHRTSAVVPVGAGG